MRSLIKDVLIILESITKGKINARLMKIKIKVFLDKTRLEQIIFFLIDLLLFPFTLFSSLFLRFIRSFGIRYLNISKWLFESIGVYPIVDHYYEPLFQSKYLKKPLNVDRDLKSIDFNIKEQLLILKNFNYNNELLSFPISKNNLLEFAYDEGSFPRGDSEYYYSMIRYFKPHRIIEIGSGQSTLMAYNAILKNKEENESYECELICIEPYEQKWLEKLKHVKIIRNKVESTELSLFNQLNKYDMLFIDSSHIIRPQGDVLFQIFSILPNLNSGVFIHFHDIFSPMDYPSEWICESKILWNEMYLLEAFLSCNEKYRIVGSLNFLANKYPNEFLAKTPLLKLKVGENKVEYALGSFWIQKN